MSQSFRVTRSLFLCESLKSKRQGGMDRGPTHIQVPSEGEVFG